MIKNLKLLQVTLCIALILLLLASICYGDDRFLYGGLLKIRQESRDNVFDNTSKMLRNENFFRFTVGLWAGYDFTRKTSAFVRLNHEPEYYLDSYKPANHYNKPNEVIIDSLFINTQDLLGLPVDLKLGRQDLVYGDGLLIADGTPIDKERTSYFNAIKSTWKIDQGHTIDLVYINDPMKDDFLPSVQMDNAGRHQLTQSDEQGVVVYSMNSIGNNMQLQPYYIFKREDGIPKSARTASVPTLDLHTMGARVVFDFNSWKLRGEFAHQSGGYQGGRGRTGYGGSMYANKVFKTTLWKPQIEAAFIYLSGDNTNTSTNEGWNPLFSRRTWISNLYSNTYNVETGFSAYWTNLQLYRFSSKLNLTSSTDLSVAYNYLRANETTNMSGSTAQYFSNNGRERGHLITAKLNHKFTKNIEGYFMLEYLLPGDFYRMRDDEMYLTTRMIFRFGSEGPAKEIGN